MSRIDFDKAISIAFENAEKLNAGGKDFTLEEALISKDGENYEITISHERPGVFDERVLNHQHLNPLMRRLIESKKNYRVYIIDARTGLFRGFRMVRD